MFYVVLWTYLVSKRFKQGSSSQFTEYDDALALYNQLQALAAAGESYEGNVISNVALADNTGRILVSQS